MFVKQYEEETNLRATLLVDCSASMAFCGEHDAMTKHEYAATAACVLAHLLTVQHDAVACRAFADGPIAETPLRTGHSQVAAIAALLEANLDSPSEASKTDLGALLRATAESIPRRGVVVLLSDLLCPADQLEEGLGMLNSKGIDPIVLHTLADDEIDFPLEGATRFVALEGTEQLDANPRSLRREYLSAMAAHRSQVEAICGRHGAEYRLVRTSEPLESVLVKLLASRARGTLRR